MYQYYQYTHLHTVSKTVAELPRWMAVPCAMSAIFILIKVISLFHYSVVSYSTFYSTLCSVWLCITSRSAFIQGRCDCSRLLCINYIRKCVMPCLSTCCRLGRSDLSLIVDQVWDERIFDSLYREGTCMFCAEYIHRCMRLCACSCWEGAYVQLTCV